MVWEVVEFTRASSQLLVAEKGHKIIGSTDPKVQLLVTTT